MKLAFVCLSLCALEMALAASDNSKSNALQARSSDKSSKKDYDAQASGYISKFPVGDVYGHGRHHGGHGGYHGPPVVYIPGRGGYRAHGKHHGGHHGGHHSYGHKSYGHSSHGGHHGGHHQSYGHQSYGHSSHGKKHYGPPAHSPHKGTYGSSGSYHVSGHHGHGHGSVYGKVSYSSNHYGFSCYGKKPSFYGDAGFDCKVFHVCQKDGRQDTFKCPKWTRFNNYIGVCDWHFKIDKGCNPIHYGYGH